MAAPSAQRRAEPGRARAGLARRNPEHALIRAGSGFGRGRDPVAAALDAALAAHEHSGAEHADLCLVFTTAGAYPAALELIHAVRRANGARAVLGCSGAGVLTERGEHEDPGGAPGEAEAAVAVLAIASDELRLAPFLVDDTEGLGSTAGVVAGARAFEGTRGAGLVMALPDAMGLEPGALLEGITEAAGPMPVVGGVAAGVPLFELYNTDAVRGALTGLALAGREPVIGVAQGCEPIGEPFVITRGEGTIVREIAGRRALEVLKEALGAVPGGQERIRSAGIFAGLAIDPAKSPLGRGDFLVRNLLGVDQAAGAISIAEPVRVGQTIQFQIRDGQAASQDLRHTLGAMTASLGDRRPAFGVYFNCAGRGAGLFGQPDHDVRLIVQQLGRFPLAGFFGNGEFAPVAARNCFHNYTGVLVIVPERDREPAA